MFKSTHINNHEEAYQMMSKYHAAISPFYYNKFEDVLLGIRKHLTIPQSEIEKWEKELKRLNEPNT